MRVGPRQINFRHVAAANPVNQIHLQLGNETNEREPPSPCSPTFPPICLHAVLPTDRRSTSTVHIPLTQVGRTGVDSGVSPPSHAIEILSPNPQTLSPKPYARCFMRLRRSTAGSAARGRFDPGIPARIRFGPGQIIRMKTRTLYSFSCPANPRFQSLGLSK